MENILVLLLTVGFSFGDLLQDDSHNYTRRQHANSISDQSISQLKAHFIEENRVPLEDRLRLVETKLRQLELHHNDVSKKLQHEVTHRQQLETMYAGVRMELDNVTSKLEIASQDNKKCGAHLSYNTNKLNNITEEVKNLQHDGSDKKQRIEDLARDLSTVKSQYTILLHKHVNMSYHLGLVPTRPTTAGLTIAFSVGYPDGTTGSGSNPLKFQSYNFNDRNVFNMNTGEFVCKHQGLYSFTYTYAARYNYSYAMCCIMKNGGRASLSSCAIAGQATSTRYSSGTVSLMLDLNLGDRVYVSECTSPTTIVQNTDFSGFLVGSN